MKKVITIILIVCSLYLAFNYINSWAMPFFNQTKVPEVNEEYYENFEQETIINVAGSYLVLETGETVRLSGIEMINEQGENLLYNALTNREVWLYRDGEDKDGIPCVYLFIDSPEYPFSTQNSLNRILCSKQYALKGKISNGYF